jgi:hypothetical protein
MLMAVVLVIGIKMMAPNDHDPMYHCSLTLIEQGHTTESSLDFCREIMKD